MADSDRQDRRHEGAEPAFAVLSPQPEQRLRVSSLTSGLASIDGKRIAFVWDYLFQGRELFALLEEYLTRNFAQVSVVGYDVFGNIHGDNEHEVIQLLGDRMLEQRVDAAVVGIGA